MNIVPDIPKAFVATFVPDMTTATFLVPTGQVSDIGSRVEGIEIAPPDGRPPFKAEPSVRAPGNSRVTFGGWNRPLPVGEIERAVGFARLTPSYVSCAQLVDWGYMKSMALVVLYLSLKEISAKLIANHGNCQRDHDGLANFDSLLTGRMSNLSAELFVMARVNWQRQAKAVLHENAGRPAAFRMMEERGQCALINLTGRLAVGEDEIAGDTGGVRLTEKLERIVTEIIRSGVFFLGVGSQTGALRVLPMFGVSVEQFRRFEGAQVPELNLGVNGMFVGDVPG